MSGDLSLKQKAMRTSILTVVNLRASRLAGVPPFALGLRWLSNRLVPWAARAGFRSGIHSVNGIALEIPRPPDWGGGGEFHMALGTYEHNEMRYLLRRLQPGDTFIDVGAHIGYLSLPIAKRVGPSGKVIALEPSPTSLELLRRNVTLNRFNWVTVVDAAASDKDGLARLHVSSQSAMWNTLCQGTLDEETGSIEVAIRSLDSLMEEHGWPSIAGIKLDVEGAELEALRGGEQVLARNPRAFVMIEVSGGNAERLEASLETLRWLEGHGYQFRRLSARGAGPPTRSSGLIPLLQRRSWYESLFNLVIERG